MASYEELEEKKVSSSQIYDGKIVKLFRDTVTLPDGNPAFREVIRHPGAVCVVPITDDGDVICVRQFRYPFSKVTLEIPAGKLDGKNEDHASAAMRELREETGATCGELVYIGEAWSSPAILDEVLYMYYAKGLTFGKADPDEDEFITSERIPLEKLVSMILSGEICDGKTQVAVLKTAMLLKEKK